MNIGDSNLCAICILGEGSFGQVYLCKSNLIENTDYVCVKRIQIRRPKFEIKMLMDEIYIISQLNHPNIVRFFRAFAFESSMNIVMEYARNGTLRDAITANTHHRPTISKKSFLSYIFEIILGLEYLHIRHVIHKDLKPENILLGNENRIKIADFGISAIHTSNKTTQGLSGTYLYMAPEVMKGERCEFKSDIWSLGCILYEMCNGVNPFKHAKNLNNLKYLISCGEYNGFNLDSISKYYGVEWSGLCKKMLVVNARKRVSIYSIATLNANIAIPYYKHYFRY